ncbi:MAG TPA: glycoside hydrolase family 2 TIM barrel-domain containing protein, partial [Tepidisphaeraceae bacterium]|nr:glycoside hydrolase family 2 TIM barrel-domain containing protein [Tepidisphaeraceae bacterium]
MPSKHMLKQTLHDHWSLRPVGDLSEVPSNLRDISIPAQIPGCVHTDLIRAAKIPDPYLDLNEYTLQWIGQTDWEYRTTFDANPKLFDHERIDLVFDGLDTIAKIELNGSLIAQTQNMFRSYRFDVRKLLKRTGNELRITFACPVKYAFAMRDKLGHLPWTNGAGGPFNFIRKMACNFGWDWGPVFVTSGIWKGVRVEGWSGARITEIRITPSHSDNGPFRVDVTAFIQRSEKATSPLYLSGDLRLSDGRSFANSMDFHDGDSASLTFEFHNAPLWRPVGYGKQPIQLLQLFVNDHLGDRHDDRELKLGLRTTELATAPDAIGREFVVKVNDKPIFCKGFNWIPDDCFPTRACDPQRVRARIEQALATGANMLRVWGGGIYETDDFYNICDELGILVWQDFPFACATYPEEEPYWSEVEAEVKENVARLSHHPSLVLWNGNNENLMAYRDWGWKPQVAGRTWGTNYYFNLIPRILKELDPTRPYWPASPWSGDPDVDNGVHPNLPTHGNTHHWKTWVFENYPTYRDISPRFCSEFGFQAPANFATIARVVPPEKRNFASAEMRHHQKCITAHDDGDLRNLKYVAEHFNVDGIDDLIKSLKLCEPYPPLPAPGIVKPLHSSLAPSRANFDDLHYLLQLNQARALTLAVEWFRSRQPVCMGTLYWQLNDCWPAVTSWATVDGDGRLKPAWFATRRFYANYLPTIQPEPDGSLSLYLINDTDEPRIISKKSLTRRTFDGKILATQQIDCQVPPRASLRVPIDPSLSKPGDPSQELLYFDDSTPAFWFFDVDKNLNYPAPKFESKLSQSGEEYRLQLSARTLIRDL